MVVVESFFGILQLNFLNFNVQNRQSFFDRLIYYWNLQLFKIGDSYITVNQIIISLIFILLAIWLVGRLRRIMEKRLFPRMGLERSAAIAMSKISYYLLIVVVVVFAFQIMNIPMTVFTIFGGAAAIGVGFGAQNIIQNFISGLILLIEHPVKVGDLIELEGTYGTVEEVGARCTRIRSLTNIHLLVPNSKLLDNTVINWTHSDNRVRTMVSVGVAYGSNVDKVFQIISQVLSENEKVDKMPEPVILFTDFGDSTLNFEAHFWLRMPKMMDRRIVESNIRRQIDKLFNQEGIVIAFPQQDVHLDTLSPLQVHVRKGNME